MKVLAKDIERRRLNNLSWGRLLITFAFHYILFYFSVIYLILLAKEINEAKVLREWIWTPKHLKDFIIYPMTLR